MKKLVPFVYSFSYEDKMHSWLMWVESDDDSKKKHEKTFVGLYDTLNLIFSDYRFCLWVQLTVHMIYSWAFTTHQW